MANKTLRRVAAVGAGALALHAVMDSDQQKPTAGILKAKDSVVRVVSAGCGRMAYGSGWEYATDRLVTNAHVVNGFDHFKIDRGPGTPQVEAKVVLFDPRRDLAIVYAPGMPLAPIPMAKSSPRPGTKGAAIGHPGAGPLTIEPMTVIKTGHFGLPDANEQPSEVKWTVAEGKVRPGNSGGPLVENNGEVLGIITRSDMNNTGYAVDVPHMRADLNAANNLTDEVATGSCVQ